MEESKITSKVLKVVFLSLFLGSFALSSSAFARDTTFFILHSYSQEYPWTKNENDGFVSSFVKKYPDSTLSISTEYLDSKRVAFTEDYQLFFVRYLKEKYASYTPDIVFCTDDNALTFLMRYKAELFPESPVVFCGVNNTDIIEDLDRRQFVGVFEVKEIIPNLTLARKLWPGLSKVFIVGDDSFTYRAIKERILKDFQGRFPGMELEFLASKKLAPIIEKLSIEREGVIILATIGGLHSEQDVVISLQTTIQKLQGAGDFIIMSMEDAYMLDGVFGGVVTSGRLQGDTAASIAEKIVKGVPADSIPLLEKSPNLPIFDFRQMAHLAVSETMLPEESVILHRTETIYQQYKKEVLTTMAIFAVLLLLLAILSVNVLRRKRAEKFLRESEEKYREIYNSPNDAIFIHDGETGKILDVNEGMLKMYGYYRDEALQLDISDFSSGKEPYTLEEAEKKVQAAIENEPQIFEWQAKKRNGELFWVEVSLKYTEIGGQGRVLAVVRDISERKRAEQEKIKLKSELYQAQKMESIGRLAGGVAHDFNNILTVINGYAEICLMGMEENQPLREEIEIIQQSGQRAARLTQQLLAFSRKQIVKQELLDLNREVDDTRKMLGRLLGENIEIEISHGKDLWPVKMDRSQMEQVVLNLAVNARDAMPSGGKLTIETANVSLDGAYIKTHYNVTPGDYVMLAVSDNGQGMDEETKGNIFEPFFTTKEQGKGTGLGLATIYGIVKQNNGEIQVYSQPGQGTTFKIYLPRVDEPIEKIEDVPSVEEISDNRGTETIMLVEDDDMVRKMSGDILTGLGYTVLEAENGEDALQVCSRSRGKVDLLLSDVVMPKMSGPALATKMQELCPETKVLFMSGYTENDIVKHGVLEDGVNFIPKPITPRSLSQAVRKVLG